jgi:hypothetical protein
MVDLKSAVAVLLIGGTVACAGQPSAGYERSRTAAANAESRSKPAPLDPSRKVVEQDCSKPIDLYRGNIQCR